MGKEQEIIEELIRLLRESVIECTQKSSDAISESASAYWDGAANAYKHTIISVEWAFNQQNKD